MERYKRKTLLRFALLLFAVVIGACSLLYTNRLVAILEEEERAKVELWAKATEMIVSYDDDQDLDFLLSIIENNHTVPVILVDDDGNIISTANLDETRLSNPAYLNKELENMRSKKQPIVIDLGQGEKQFIYYKESSTLTSLTIFPLIQLVVISFFIVIAYLAFSASQKAEKNNLWTSMSKETAHQLGTPTSSLSGWVEVLQERYPDTSIVKEIGFDVNRLEKITERFSSIGTRPVLKEENLVPVIFKTVDYLKKRASSKVKFVIDLNIDDEIVVPLNISLFEWVIENISKNAIDAMEGVGVVSYSIKEGAHNITINITDTGKGMPKNVYKRIFKPGYTTKQHGWGLGLSLAKRIVEEFHKGKIFVKWSEPGKGSCISISLRK